MRFWIWRSLRKKTSMLFARSIRRLLRSPAPRSTAVNQTPGLRTLKQAQ